MDWYIIGIISALFFGIQKFLFKVAAENNSSTKQLTLSFMITVSLLGLITFLFTGTDFTNFQQLALIALFNGLFFLLVSIFRYESIKYIPGTVAFPLMEMTSVLVILFAVVFLRETISVRQTIGVILAIIVSFLLLQQHKDEQAKYDQYIKGIFLVLIAVVAGALTQIISKYIAVSEMNLLLYITVSYFYNTLYIGAYQLVQAKKKFAITFSLNKSIYYGVLIGITNFIAFYSYLKALEPGSLAIVTILLSFSALLPVILSIAIYKDKLTVRRTVAIILTIVSLILIR